jgi:hypothetical protein
VQVFHVLALSSGEGVWCKLVHHPLGSVQDPPAGMAWVSMWVTGDPLLAVHAGQPAVRATMLSLVRTTHTRDK